MSFIVLAFASCFRSPRKMRAGWMICWMPSWRYCRCATNSPRRTRRRPRTKHPEPQEAPSHETKVAIIGHPNVGKSTLLNRLTGAERSIVSPIPGTTRDAVDEIVEHDGKRFRFIDTAGIRRKGKTHLMAEKLSVVMARKHLEAADIALLVIDATEGVSQLDAAIAGYAHESGRSMIIIVNKWDLVSAAKSGQAGRRNPRACRRTSAQRTAIAYEERLRDALKFLSYAPILFVSASTGKGTEKIFPTLEEVATERRKRIGTGEMNRFLKHVDFERASVPARQQVRIYLHDPGGGRAADFRHLHRPQSKAALCLPALSGKPDSQSLRICGHADLDQEPRPGLNCRWPARTFDGYSRSLVNSATRLMPALWASATTCATYSKSRLSSPLT